MEKPEESLMEIANLKQENARLKDALRYISFASNGYPTRYDSKDVPEEYQSIIRSELRHLGEHAELALLNKIPIRSSFNKNVDDYI